MKLLKMNRKIENLSRETETIKSQGNFRTNIITETKISLDGLNGVTEEKAAYLKIDEKKLYNLNTREKKIGGKK